MASRGWRPQLTAWVDQVDLAWQRLGLSAAQRAELRLELVRDVAQAVAEGAPPSEFWSVDPTRFAGDVVASGRVPPAVEEVRSPRAASAGRAAVVPVVVGGLVGTAVGALASVLPVLAVLGWTFHHVPPGSTRESAVILGAYAAAAAFSALAGGIGISVACDAVPGAGRPVLRGTVGLLVSGAVATALTVGYASTTGFSTRPRVVLEELALVAVVLVVGLVVVGSRVSQKTG